MKHIPSANAKGLAKAPTGINGFDGITQTQPVLQALGLETLAA